jgi:hypothetical protein
MRGAIILHLGMCCREGGAAEPDAKRARAEDGAGSQVQSIPSSSPSDLYERLLHAGTTQPPAVAYVAACTPRLPFCLLLLLLLLP